MVKRLYEKKAELATQARAILDAAKADKRDAMNAEENSRFDAIMADVDALQKTIDAHKRSAEIDASLTEAEPRRAGPNAIGDPEVRSSLAVGRRDQDLAMRAWIATAAGEVVTDEMRSAANRCRINLDSRAFTFELRSAYGGEAQMTSNSELGGYTTQSEMLQALEVALKSHGAMRNVARVIRTATGNPLPIPTSDDTANEAVIVDELDDALMADEPIVFDQKSLTAWKYTSKSVKVPTELLQDSAINIPLFVGEALGRRIARGTEKHFAIGNGSSQPQGLFTAAVTAGETGAVNATPIITGENLVNLYHSIDPAYRHNAVWMFNDATLKLLRKVRDPETDELVWQESLRDGTPATILGKAYVINNSAPVPAPGATSIVFGDFSAYWIRDVQAVQLRRLDERYAEYGAVAFVAVSRHDARYINAGTHPIKRFVHGAAS